MNAPNPQRLVDDATFDFTMGETDEAIRKLNEAIKIDPEYAAAWHAMAEIEFDRRDLAKALEAGQKALSLNEADVHLHTTLSRIHMERGDKDQAEKHGARARVLGWKEQLGNEPPPS